MQQSVVKLTAKRNLASVEHILSEVNTNNQ